ncbi:oxidoreductase [Alkalilimnicola ehrlichii]|uniref:Oxidoreductase n=1 Tax=Alkalilimnicola ehrlichii TaxID=351052 RepID=A0A3E0WJJ9_9GAMM|nr:oxidoreductase [Alkalilimnicola ehrlichii]RFA33124.1 oxidoreductase [Alkalilimnicola ehrlichii]
MACTGSSRRHVRVGVIGAGAWGSNLVRNFHQLGVLGGIADNCPQRCQALRQTYPDIPCHRDMQALLASEVDAVAVATPVKSHYEVVKAALLSGKDVFVEKPLTTNLAKAEELQALASRLGRILVVGHLVLFQPAVQWIRDYLREGRLGTIRSIHQERLNLGRVRDYENALWCLGSHDVAVQLYLLDSLPHELRVHGQCVHQDHIEDDVHLHLGYPGGIQSHLHVSWWWPTKRRSLTILGTEGILVYDEIDQTVTRHYKGIGNDLDVRDEGSELLCEGHGEPLKLELEHFLDCVRQRRLQLADNQYAVDVVRVIAAASEQLRTQAARQQGHRERVPLKLVKHRTGELL